MNSSRQPVKQFVDREIDHFGADGAGLDLVYVEQRVQHARHGAQRVVDPCDQFLGSLALDDLGQQSLQQGKRLQRLAQVMARRGEKPRFRDIGQICLPLGYAQLVRRVPPLGDVGECDDDALDPIVLGAVRQYATDVPGAALRFDLSLDRREAPQHRSCIGQKSAVGSQRIEVRERPPDVAGNDTEKRLGGRREEADIEVGVEEERRDIGAVQNILQIVGGRTLPLQRFLELAVEGGKLLVERLQFLLRRQQLLVRRLVFLIDGQRFFVDRLLLFAGNLQVADGTLQFRSRGFEFLLELGDPRNVAPR